MPIISRGFLGKKRDDTDAERIPPGQHLTSDFPVLSAGPTPSMSSDTWSFSLEIEGQAEPLAHWDWAAFQTLPQEDVTQDINCVTHWEKLDTRWRGVSLDTLLEMAGEATPFVTAYCEGGYTTNLQVSDITDGKAWIVHEYEGQPLAPEHGGPARLLVPHLYFWKSAKWVRGLRFTPHDVPGFWETRGYHLRGDPWKEQRYTDD